MFRLGLCFLALVPLALAVTTAPAAAQTTVTLTATDGKCMSPTGSNWNDNRFRAYWSSGTDYVDGFVKFDMSSIPDTATITAMTLTAYHEAGFSNPFDNPEVQVYRTAGDSWSRGPTDSHPGLDEVLSPVMTGFPSTDLTPVAFGLDVTAAAWGTDLADDTLSLVLRNVAGAAGRYSYVYFYSSDSSPAPPELEVTYVDGLNLSITGPCPGAVTVDIGGATPGGNVAIAKASALGAFVVPGGFPCVGTTLGLSGAGLMLVTVVTADASGNVSFPAQVPGSVCGSVFVQAIDLTSCSTSNVVGL